MCAHNGCIHAYIRIYILTYKDPGYNDSASMRCKDPCPYIHTYTHSNEYRLDPDYKDSASMGYRDLCLNVEVGWSLQNGVVHFEDVKNWADMECRTLICEIQGMYSCVCIYAYLYEMVFQF
jgi:hypothetical protein